MSEELRGKHNVYGYEAKNDFCDDVSVRCPADIPKLLASEIRTCVYRLVRALGIRGVARFDFRVASDGSFYFLEVNATPSMEKGSSMFEAARLVGYSYEDVIRHMIQFALGGSR